MARFYKTASASPLDYMYRINAPLMERVIAANDSYITQNLTQAQQLGTLAASFPYLQDDEGRAREIIEGYSKQVDDITSAIRSDPAGWRKHVDPIRNLSRDLEQNYRVGEISKMSSNYGQYKKVADYIDEQVKEYNKSGKGISGDRARAYKEYFLNQFKGTNYNPKTGEYDSIKVFDPMGNIDVRKLLSEELDKIKSDKTRYKKSEVTGDEWYFNDKTQEWEGITPDKILSIVTDRLNNPQLIDYLRQDTEVGLINGVFDEQGRFIAPYNYKGVPISPMEQKNIENFKAQLAKVKDRNQKSQLESQLRAYEDQLADRKELEWNNQSYLAPIMRGIVQQFSYQRSSTEDVLRNNSKGSTKFVQAQQNARQAASLAQQKAIADMKEAGINDRFNRTMEWDKYKWEHPQEKKTTTGTSTPKKKGEESKKIPAETTVSRFYTNSFEDWTTTDANGETVKVLSNEGLSADIDRLKKEELNIRSKVKDLDTKMKNYLGNRRVEDLNPAQTVIYNRMLVDKEAAQQTLPKIQSDLNARRKWYEASVNAALTNNPNARKDKDGDFMKELTPEEIQIYKEGEAGEKKKEAQIAAWKKEADEINKKVAGYAYANDPVKQREAVTKMKELRKKASDLKVQIGKGGLFDDNGTSYKSVKKKVDKMRDNFLAQIRYTPIDTDGIKLGDEDSEVVARMILENPRGTKLFDNTGNKTDNVGLEGKGISWFDPKGDNFKMTTADDANNLFNYMLKHNVKFKVEQVGNTTKIGDGNAVAQVTFDDPNGQIEKSYFYIELTPELQKRVATRLSQSKDTEVQSIAGNMLDSEANDIRRQLITPTIQRTAGAADNYDPVTFTIFISNGNQKIPFQVTKFAASDGTDHLNITGSVNGVQVPLPNTPSGIPGWFNGADDFINYIKTQRQTK